MIREIIIVEGRDDERAVRAALDAEIIVTHGYGISAATFSRIEKAAESCGIIIFTDPDHAGELIRKRIGAKFPDAKHAFLAREDAEKAGDIGIENASPESIREAISKARGSVVRDKEEFTHGDLLRYGLTGAAGSAQRRDQMGRALGIGYGNSGTFLRRLNRYGITREEFEKHGQALFPYSG